MNIVIVTEHYWPNIGGVEFAFREFAKNFTRLGHRVRVLTSTSAGVQGDCLDQGVEIHRFPWPSIQGHPWPNPRDLIDHIKWADVVQTTLLTAAKPTLYAAKSCGRPCVLLVPEIIGDNWTKVCSSRPLAKVYQLCEAWSHRDAYAHYVVISQATFESALRAGIPRNKISLIYLGIDDQIWNPEVQPLDLARVMGFGADAKIFVYFGRPGLTKGTDLLLQAVGKLDRILPPNFKFGFILSRKPPGGRKAFESLLAELSVRDRIRVIDSVDRNLLPGLIKSSFCVVVPSRTEGFGFSAAESCALGVPVICSDAGSLPEVVSGNRLVFKTGDSDDLAKCITAASNGQFATVARREFNWPTSTEKLLEVYSLVSQLAI